VSTILLTVAQLDAAAQRSIDYRGLMAERRRHVADKR